MEIQEQKSREPAEQQLSNRKSRVPPWHFGHAFHSGTGSWSPVKRVALPCRCGHSLNYTDVVPVPLRTEHILLKDKNIKLYLLWKCVWYRTWVLLIVEIVKYNHVVWIDVHMSTEHDTLNLKKFKSWKFSKLSLYVPKVAFRFLCCIGVL
jgi:hypothetical protein